MPTVVLNHKAYETFAEYDLAEVLPFVGLVKKKEFSCPEYGSFRVNLDSQRLCVFKKSVVCVACNLSGSMFRLQRSRFTTITPHLNLYGCKDGEWILFTKDHILPKSKGGKDYMSNYQTMCYVCNYAKGNKT